MSELLSFRPPRRQGILFHIGMILFLGITSGLAFLIGINQQIGAYFVLLLLLSLLLFAPLPWLIYRAFALTRAVYRLERDGLRLRWGLRSEDIPLPDIEWVRRSTDLASDLRLPPLHWPGALLGVVNVPDLGPVEYMAADSKSLLLIATPRRVYAISPEDSEGFLRSFQRTLEMGSLAPLSSVSVLPAAYLSQVWSDIVARIMLVSGLALNLLLFACVSLVIPGKASASLGFYPNGAPLPSGPSTQLLLLPILGAFIYVVDLATGLFFYRRDQDRLLAFLAWGSAVVSVLLMIIAFLLILFNTR